MQKSFNVALDLKRTLPIEDITMIEGDTGNRLIISVVDDGHPVDLTGCFVIVAFQRKDCVMWQSSANPDVIISDNTVTVDVLTESISADETYCEIQIYSDVERTELVTTSRFVIYVNKGIINDSAVQATNDYPILSQLVEDVEQIRSEFLEALERLQQIIDNLGGSGGILAKHAYTHALNGNDPVTPDSIGASNAPYFLTITISASGFNGSYTQRIIDLDEIKGTDYIIASPLLLGGSTSDLSNEIKSWNLINKIAVSQGALYIYCYDELPTHDITVQLIGTHANMERGHCVLAGHSGHSNGSNIGHGIPAGGTAGQTLVKRTSEDYDVDWLTPTGGGGGTPYAHASTHAAGGSDPITPASIRAAPTSHASNTTGYGAGNGTNYGHLKLSDSVNSTLGISGGTAAAPVAVKAAYDLAASRADADHNHDDRYALIGHTHSGSGTSVEYKTITVPLDGWDAGVPCTQTISVAGVATTDYISAKYTSNAINTNERVADHAAYCCVTDGTPTPGGVLLTCWHERPTRDIRMILRVEHGGTMGYMVMTGQAQPSSGTKTANGSVVTAEQAITVTGLGFRPSMVSFIGSSGKTTITSGHGVDTGSTTAAWYADASGPGNVGTFAPSDDGFVLTVQGTTDPKTLNVGWQAVGSCS